ncbi:MAG: hypothetical protein EOS30_21905 [Mesorhizobium sp.]|nr:hypothetical protein EN746_32250 [Mesorhizobium sp. M8A.F.Ca.ET.023.02.2.1]RWC69511.1 MAG: hypothetical protein EOS30_21905 [Mesorhizobium sp.]TIW88425.1 MAG: hypothetical protein E5V51_08130 [Mesorhizobium sp.]
MGRKALRGIAADVAASFISRNNDADGYWAIGKLHAHAREHSTAKILIDLSGQLSGTLSEFASIAAKYRSMIETQTAAKGLRVCSSQIEIEFDLPKTRQCSAYETGYTCAVMIVDDRGQAWIRKVYGCSHPHDPKRERRSSRAKSEAEAR